MDQVQRQQSAPPKDLPDRRSHQTVSFEESIEVALEEAAAVQRTGQQSAVEVWPGSPDLLDELRVHVRRRLRGGVDVDPLV